MLVAAEDNKRSVDRISRPTPAASAHGRPAGEDPPITPPVRSGARWPTSSAARSRWDWTS